MTRHYKILVCVVVLVVAVSVVLLAIRQSGTESRNPVPQASNPAQLVGISRKDRPVPVDVIPTAKSFATNSGDVVSPDDSDGDDAASRLRRWTAVSPREAAAWVEGLPDGAEKRGFLEDVAIVWAGKDSTAALEWASQLPSGEGREMAVIATGYEAARDNPTNALMAAMALESGPGRNRLILHAVRQWAVTDPTAALLWVETVKEGGLRDELFADMATAWAQQDGKSAAALASQTIRGGPEYRRAVVAVVQRWAQSDPAAALAWVERLPEAPLRSNCWEALNLEK